MVSSWTTGTCVTTGQRTPGNARLLALARRPSARHRRPDRPSRHSGPRMIPEPKVRTQTLCEKMPVGPVVTTLGLLGWLSLLRRVRESIFLNSDVVHVPQEARTSSHEETGPSIAPPQTVLGTFCWCVGSGSQARRSEHCPDHCPCALAPPSAPWGRRRQCCGGAGTQVLVTRLQEMQSLGGGLTPLPRQLLFLCPPALGLGTPVPTVADGHRCSCHGNRESHAAATPGIWGMRGWECGVGGGSPYPAVPTPLARGLKRSSPEPQVPRRWAGKPRLGPRFLLPLLRRGAQSGPCTRSPGGCSPAWETG